ncbi:Spy/CpxP family protein refolding chaperone [Shewanella salipaludis]|uniref:Spy/CpxP family protein refolding chaperone n=1 Tax=Shewanella salipaludis TaxID=2723052 RepID=A0A972JKH6_9GAMM|nr:Spy/CpxP family protein refolding chaperone [Shewanella salipaludis]NMH67163.1 Spy/CpxP family protein refolding chaperone [Shewanella salipaludis]
MKTLSPLKTGLFVLLAGSAILATSVQAEPCTHEPHERGKMAHHDGMHGMLRGLDLTDAQKAEVKKLFEQHKAAREAEGQQGDLRAAHREAMLALITATSFDEAQARQLISAREAKHEAREIERMKMQNEIYHLLTPEQQAKYKEHLAKPRGKEGRR